MARLRCLACGKLSKGHGGRRDTGKCSHCGHAFVFHLTPEPFSDQIFRQAYERASRQGALRIHPRQLYYGLAQDCVKPEQKSFWKRRSKPQLPPFSYESFEGWLKRWRQAYGELPALIGKPLRPRPATEADLLDYGLEKAIICDHPELVDFLLANNFHIEQKCALLTSGGYPAENFETIRALLRRNPQINVFVLHNASYNGCRIHQDLTSSSDWFPGSKRVFDVGLQPRHVAGFSQALCQQASGGKQVPIPGLGRDEMEWLRDYKLELMAISPARLLRRLQQVLQGHSRRIAEAYADGSSPIEIEAEPIALADESVFEDDDFG